MHAVCALALSGALLAEMPPEKIEHQVPDEALQTAQGQAKGASVTQIVISLYIFGALILWITLAVMTGLGVVMFRAGKDLSDPTYMRAFCAVLVLGFGTFLVVAGYSAVQMAAMFSLMGAIIGYVFGDKGRRPSPPPPQP